jgi:hypothetical protein
MDVALKVTCAVESMLGLPNSSDVVTVKLSCGPHHTRQSLLRTTPLTVPMQVSEAERALVPYRTLQYPCSSALWPTSLPMQAFASW